jgi:type IV pilus assembly protein PilC
MPAFRYKAKNSEGRALEGSIEADTEDAARLVLRQRKFTILEIGKVKTGGFFNKGPKVKQADVVIFSRQLATMVGSGLPLVSAIGIIAEQCDSKNLRTVLLQVRDDVSAGVNVSEALAKHPNAFIPLYVNMVHAGETGGSLDVILERLSTYLEKAEALQGKIKSAMIYPIGIIVVSTVVVVFLMVAVVPTFKSVFQGFGKALPLPTQILVDTSDFLQTKLLYLIGAAVAAWVGYISFKQTAFGSRFLDALILKTPLFGSLMLRFTVARFTRTLGTLQKSGVPILDSMDIVAKTAGNKIIEEAILKARASMREGEGVVGPLKATKVFPSMVIQMVGAGEETGKLDDMLMRIADFYDREVDTAVEGLLKMIEPITMVVLGGIVALIVLGMYLPMFEMGGMAGG